MFPQFTGERVVDAADVLPPAVKLDIEAKSKALEDAKGIRFVVVTVPSLGGYPVTEYGYRLGRAWGLGQKGKNNGVILLVAPKEAAGHREVRIEVGYGVEPVMTDALSRVITSQVILPRFKAGDVPGGVTAGADAIVKQLGLPEEQGRALAAAARAHVDSAPAAVAPAAAQPSGGGDGIGIGGAIFIFLLILLVIWIMRRRSGGYGGGPVIWGPGWGGGFGGAGGGGFDSGGADSGPDLSIGSEGGSFGGGGADDSW